MEILFSQQFPFGKSFTMTDRHCARSVRAVAARSTMGGFLLPRWVDAAEEAGGGGEKWWWRTGVVRAVAGVSTPHRVVDYYGGR
jgi:hypothetical protein